jgi:transcriptional regulator with XRE-family HTH domain
MISQLLNLDLMGVTREIKSLMFEHRISTRDVEAQSGVDHSTISRMLGGKRSSSFNSVVAVCQALHEIVEHNKEQAA